MRKILSILLFAILVFNLIPALAESSTQPKYFNRSVFSTSEYSVAYDDFEGDTYVDSTANWRDNFKFTHSNPADGYFSVIYPDILVLNSESSTERSIFRIWISYMSDSWLFADTAIVKIGSNRYTIDDIDVKTDVMDGGDVNEKLLFVIAKENEDFMEDWCATTESIKIRLKGSKGNIDFTVPSSAQKIIADMYLKFKEADPGTWTATTSTKITKN